MGETSSQINYPYHEIPIKEVWWGVHKIMIDHNWTIVNVSFQKMSRLVES